MNEIELDSWLEKISSWAQDEMAGSDSGHDIDHVRRVVTNARSISASENADLRIVLPAAWLHDCVNVPKNSPLRSQASRLAASKASDFLRSILFTEELIDPIAHCILAHSFSAGVPCESLEARVVQDADRLEAVGAIGIARCLMTGGAMRQRLYHPDNPFPLDRKPEDTVQSIDHFFSKLLRLDRTMQTESGRKLASQRTQFMVDYLMQLSSELNIDQAVLEQSIQRVREC